MPWTDAASIQQLAPYTDFVCEYPPGAVTYMGMLRSVFDGLNGYVAAHHALMVLFFAIGTVSLVWVRRTLLRHADSFFVMGTFGFTLAMLEFIAPFRFDAIPVALTGLAFFAMAKRAPNTAGILLGVAGAIKIWPAFVAPLLAAAIHRRSGWKPAVLVGLTSGGAFLAVHLVLLIYGTQVTDLFGYLTYMSDRPLQIEAGLTSIVVAVASVTGASIGSALDYGSINLVLNGQAIEPQGLLFIFLAVYAALVFYTWALARNWCDDQVPVELAKIGGLAVLSLMLLSPVLSTEYLLWMMPFVALASMRQNPIPVIMFSIAVLSARLSFDHLFAPSGSLPVGLFLSGVKNVALLAVGASLLFDVARHQGVRPALIDGLSVIHRKSSMFRHRSNRQGDTSGS
ncbi:MAG: glycosyltransferase 87 family protein [Pseudomonadota bacterium]